MAVWSKVLPLTASYLSPLSGFESHPRHVVKLPVTWGKALVFARYSDFLYQLQLASHDLEFQGKSLGTPNSSTLNNWLLTSKQQYGGHNDKKLNTN